MTSSQLGRWQLALRNAGNAFMLGVVSVACSGAPGPDGPIPELPAGCPRNAPPSTTAELQACRPILEFDTLEAAGDEQVLTIIEAGTGSPCPGSKNQGLSCRYGPQALIQPEMRSHELKFRHLNEGRIIATLFLKAGETQRYDSLAVVPGHATYWWVQVTDKTEKDLDDKYRRAEKEGQAHTKKYSYGRSVFVSEAPGAGGKLVTKEYPLQYVKHPDKFKQALARWVWDPDDEKTQGSCGQGCCR
jgi:hypothetical protein